MPLNKFVAALLILLSAAPSTLVADPVTKPNDVVAICGDSLTQLRRYSAMLEDYLLMCQPVPNVRTVQFGSNGATANVLGQRIGDIALFHPTAATVLYGGNDTGWKPIYDGRVPGFRTNLNYSLDKLGSIGVKNIVLATPMCVGEFGNWGPYPDGTKWFNAALDSLVPVTQDIAAQRKLPLAEVHADMADAIGKMKAAGATSAQMQALFGVHPEQCGQLIIAYAFLKAMGFDGNIGTITVDLAANQAQASAGHKVLSMKDGVVEVESTRYPFCFSGDPNQMGPDTANILKYAPFNDDLNRFRLVVHGLKTRLARITWGSQSLQISAGDLEKGINLAALFVPNNPFSDQFSKVDAAVHRQQDVESILTWQFLANLGRYKQILPPQDALYDEITQDGLAECNRYAKNAAALVVPVHHTIAIEPISDSTK